MCCDYRNILAMHGHIIFNYKLQVLVQKTPHMIAHSERVRLFRRAVSDEKVILYCGSF